MVRGQSVLVRKSHVLPGCINDGMYLRSRPVVRATKYEPKLVSLEPVVPIAAWQSGIVDSCKDIVKPKSFYRTSTFRAAHRPAPDQINDLVRRYEAGATIYELATQFGVHRHTVSRCRAPKA